MSWGAPRDAARCVADVKFLRLVPPVLACPHIMISPWAAKPPCLASIAPELPALHLSLARVNALTRTPAGPGPGAFTTAARIGFPSRISYLPPARGRPGSGPRGMWMQPCSLMATRASSVRPGGAWLWPGSSARSGGALGAPLMAAFTAPASLLVGRGERRGRRGGGRGRGPLLRALSSLALPFTGRGRAG
jgi:hypothetical protein